MTIEINLNEKRKKGRPKKNLQITLNDASYTLQSQVSVVPEKDDEKKKRGRKKKEVVEEEVKIKKKRGRKAALKYFSSSIRKQIPLKTNIVDNENGILFLDIKESNENLSNTSLTYDSFDTNKTEQFDFETHNNLETQNNFETKDNGQEQFDTDTHFETNKMDSYKTESPLNANSCSNKFNMKEISNTHEFNDEIASQKYNIKKGFFKILNQFSNWTAKTDIKCWWCCHNFDTVPLGMPIYYDHTVNKFSVRGIFCSFSCMLSYSRNTKGVNSKSYLINYLYKKLTGVIGINFKEAPYKYVLKEFGGHLSIEEFRNLSSEMKSYKMIEYPMYMSRDYIAEVDLASIKQVNTKVFNNFSKVITLDDKKVEDAKYRISKIVNHSTPFSNTIEDFIKN
jgi:hypothetical protein